MITRYFGEQFNIEKLRDLTEIGKEGVNILGISDAAEKIGFRTQALQASLQELQNDYMNLGKWKHLNGKYNLENINQLIPELIINSAENKLQ